MKHTSIDDYIEAADPAVRPRLQAIRALVRAAVPDAEERISYQLPAFKLGKVFFYFGAFKHHIGVYPPVRDPALLEELTPWRGTEKGNLSFPHDQPLPEAILRKVVLALVRQYSVGGPPK